MLPANSKIGLVQTGFSSKQDMEQIKLIGPQAMTYFKDKIDLLKYSNVYKIYFFV